MYIISEAFRFYQTVQRRQYDMILKLYHVDQLSYRQIRLKITNPELLSRASKQK